MSIAMYYSISADSVGVAGWGSCVSPHRQKKKKQTKNNKTNRNKTKKKTQRNWAHRRASSDEVGIDERRGDRRNIEDESRKGIFSATR